MKAPTIRAIPPAVANALREVHGLVVHRSPYDEVATALAAAASLPDAAGPEVTELIALERLEAVERYPAEAISDDDIERVLQLTEDQRAAMPPDKRDWLLQRACWNRPALVLRHLVPQLAELEKSVHADAETLESLRRQISIARGEPQPPIEQDEEPADESNGTFSEDFIEGIRYAYHHQKMG